MTSGLLGDGTGIVGHDLSVRVRATISTSITDSASV